MLKTLTRYASNRFVSAVHAIPAPEKKHKGGEDAYYTNPRALAIADGVGGWAASGVDPAKYAWDLMHKVQEKLETTDSLSPKEILRLATRETKEKGSSTCCLLIINPSQPEVYAGNVGDSGFYVLRKNEGNFEAVYQSEATLHGFNFPYQLGTNGDSSDKGTFYNLTVKDQDFLVLFTDGVSDNVFKEQILALFKDHETDGLTVIAEKIATLAEKQSLNRNWDSPFALEARSAQRRWHGGKPDDITVIVAQIHLISPRL